MYVLLSTDDFNSSTNFTNKNFEDNKIIFDYLLLLIPCIVLLLSLIGLYIYMEND